MAAEFFLPAGHLDHADHVCSLPDNPWRIVATRKHAAIAQARMASKPLCLAPFGNISFGHGFLGMGPGGAGLLGGSAVGGVFYRPVRIANRRDDVFNPAGKSSGS